MVTLLPMNAHLAHLTASEIAIQHALKEIEASGDRETAIAFRRKLDGLAIRAGDVVTALGGEERKVFKVRK